MTTSGGIGGLPASSAVDCEPTACSVAHSATGWCAALTGSPVILLVQIPCDGTDPIVITIDAETGIVLPNGPVVPCGDKDWEVNQICDVDQVTGQVLATVTEIFEWDETTGSLTRTLEKADVPGVPYVPVGQLQACSGGQLQAISQIVCGNDAGVLRQLTEIVLLDTLDGTIRFVFYIDAEGTVTTPGVGETFTVGDCYTSTLDDILETIEDNGECCADGNEILNNIFDKLDEIDGNTDDLEACCAATNVLLTDISGYVDGIEGQLTTIIGHVDGIEPLLSAISGSLLTIIGHVDGLEGLVTTTNSLLTTIIGHVDGVEGTLTSILAAVDDLETCCASTNTLLTGISGYVDGLEGLLTTIIGHVDGIEALLTTGNATLVSILGAVDGLEACCASTNSLLTTIAGYVDGLEGFVTATHYAEDSVHASGATGEFVLGVRNDAGAVLTSANGDYSPFATDSAGRIGVANLGTPLTVDGTLTVIATPTTSGGLSIYKNLDVNATGQNIKASAGQIYTITAINRANSERFLKFFNKASAPITGTDIPVITIPLDGRTGGGQTQIEVEAVAGLAFSLGIGVAATNGIADLNTANPSVNDVVVTIGYK